MFPQQITNLTSENDYSIGILKVDYLMRKNWKLSLGIEISGWKLFLFWGGCDNYLHGVAHNIMLSEILLWINWTQPKLKQ
jgi:hypothetical protein